MHGRSKGQRDVGGGIRHAGELHEKDPQPEVKMINLSDLVAGIYKIRIKFHGNKGSGRHASLTPTYECVIFLTILDKGQVPQLLLEDQIHIVVNTLNIKQIKNAAYPKLTDEIWPAWTRGELHPRIISMEIESFKPLST